MEVNADLVIQKLLDKIKDLNLQLALLEAAMNLPAKNENSKEKKGKN